MMAMQIEQTVYLKSQLASDWLYAITDQELLGLARDPTRYIHKLSSTYFWEGGMGG